ncbi:DUF6763 family protein [Methylocaldum sp.]|uniref:DUF6763 family protein n=1 Tax=Methylocaldum sp. TaxID=1969727 RepID=UPI002D4AC76D|nr:DUF6763 family protein [Methylocaldum sp.]HYE35891.1 DUF6763 family protein [Methylocaldum sp.]
MATDSDPIVDMWYKHYDKGEKFKVVAVDDDAKLVEIQYYDGDIDELDFYTWYQLPIEPIETPEDQTAPVDRVEPDDLDYSETSMPESWEVASEGVKNPKDSWNQNFDETGEPGLEEEE